MGRKSKIPAALAFLLGITGGIVLIVLFLEATPEVVPLWAGFLFFISLALVALAIPLYELN